MSGPERIWLLDYGSGECTWCDCPDPDSEDHDAVEYVRADTAAAAIEMWRQLAQAIEAGTDETRNAAQPEGRERGPKGAAK